MLTTTKLACLATLALATFTPTVSALPKHHKKPKHSSSDQHPAWNPPNPNDPGPPVELINGLHPCNASCVHSLVKKTSYSSAAVGVVLAMSEYGSVDWCHSPENIGWCPPTVEAVLDSIAINVAARKAPSDTDGTHTIKALMDSTVDFNCDKECLRKKLEHASRRAATAGMLWAKHKVSGVVWDVKSELGPDKIDWAIRMLSPNDKFIEELKTDTADVAERSTGTEKRGLPTVLDDASQHQTPSSVAGRDITEHTVLARTDGPNKTDPRALWEPRMQYITSTPSRIRFDSWLGLRNIREQYEGVLRDVGGLSKLDLEGSWLKYMHDEWMSGPPTQKPKQYVDWVGADLAGKTLPAEALQKLRGATVNETVWRWVEDWNSAKAMDPWEGRPDSRKPNNETSSEPVTEYNGIPDPGKTSPIIRAAWPFEMTLGKDQQPHRLPHTHPFDPEFQRWTDIGIPPPPKDWRTWTILDNNGHDIWDSIGKVPIVLQPGSSKPQTRYGGPLTIWGDQFLGDNKTVTAPWCNSACFAASAFKMSDGASKAALLGVLTTYNATNWCTATKQDRCNITSIVKSATKVGTSFASWHGQDCVTKDCQSNVAVSAAYLAEIVTMTLSKKALTPHLSALRPYVNTSQVIVDGLISESIASYENLTGYGNITAGNFTRTRTNKAIARSLELEGRSPVDPAAKPGGNFFTRAWARMVERIRKIIRVLKGGPKTTPGTTSAPNGPKPNGPPSGPEPEDPSPEGPLSNEPAVDDVEANLDDVRPGEGRINRWMDNIEPTDDGVPTLDDAVEDLVELRFSRGGKFEPWQEGEAGWRDVRGWTTDELGYDPETTNFRWEKLNGETTRGYDPDGWRMRIYDEMQIEARAQVHNRAPTAQELTEDAEFTTPYSEDSNSLPSGYDDAAEVGFRNPEMLPPEDPEAFEPGFDGNPEMERPGFRTTRTTWSVDESVDVVHSSNWSPEMQAEASIEMTTSGDLYTSAGPATQAEFTRAYEAGDPVAEAQMPAFDVQPGGMMFGGDGAEDLEFGEGAGALEELVEDGAIEWFDGGMEVVEALALFLLELV
ncbi:hypothetical protein LTR56_021390 [Elasticomyces elasticus]|nr:hypothetical protein LTR56_021390 [Elasticomyces elasticus]KAK3625178.1 hypothetical protein LTR22_023679 [Elasticomyces elasticus]KAK4920996.1 hypothetical protein LTR49_011540 [Elasticomyces elasticus]KAK5759499.1 hypothetical protein LTS12_010357 [Elasticomyces elasticus]